MIRHGPVQKRAITHAIVNAGIKELMKYRLALAAKKGCQFVEPDNVCLS